MDARETDVLAAQIGRPLRAASRVIMRCHLGLPVVAEVPPILDTGEPFPTRYWLTCPLAHRRVARLEAAGGVRDAERRAAEEPEFAKALRAAHKRYAAERDALVPSDAAHRPSGGVGGAREGVKCLHAHLADYWSGAANPVGERVDEQIGTLDCEVPCVVGAGSSSDSDSDSGSVRRNPAWSEPPVQL